MNDVSPLTPSQPDLRVATALRWGGAVGIVLVAVVRCVVAFAPQVVFDVDPALDPTPWPGLGPAGSLFLDALMLAACGSALLGELLSGRGVEWALLVLALVPAPIIVWHGVHDAGDLWRGSTWVAAAVACATVAHLGRDGAVRFVILALLAAVLVPVLARGVLQSGLSIGGLTISGAEHTDALNELESSRDAFYADRGWTADSPAARIYERRLTQPDPRGWFPTSNLFAALMAFGLVLSAGLATGAVRDRIGRRWVSLFIGAVVVTALALLMARSKGAILATGAGLLVLAARLGPVRVREFMERHGGTIAIGLLAAALLGVAVRGALLPEGFMNERSLLFRWHYLTGAGEVIASNGSTGVGPDGFQVAYTKVRPPRSPEEVASAHNVFVDWLVTLGVSGAAWIGLVGVLIWRAGRGSYHSATAAYVTARTSLAVSAIVAVLGLVPAIVMEAAVIDGPMKELARGVGVLGFVLAAVGLGLGLERIRAAIVQAALAAAVITVVLHSQIEMTCFDPGAVTWAMCLVGLAGRARTRPAQGASAWPGYALIAMILAAGPLLATLGAGRAARAQSITIEAASRIHPPAEFEPMQALQRQEAAGLLETAWHRVQPNNALLGEEALRQLVIAAGYAEPSERMAIIDRAVRLGQEALVRHDTPSVHALLGEVLWLKAATTGARQDWRAAIDRNLDLVGFDPNGISSWRRVGDLLWQANEREEAAMAYERALQADAAFELDPLKQLADRDRALLLTRIEEGTSAAGSDDAE